MAIFFYFDEISKMWAWEPKMSCWVLSEVIFWPKWSFCNRALLRFFMHMETHFSTISFYLNLQIKNFFKMARLMYIYVFSCRGNLVNYLESLRSAAQPTMYSANILKWNNVELCTRLIILHQMPPLHPHNFTLFQ